VVGIPIGEVLLFRNSDCHFCIVGVVFFIGVDCSPVVLEVVSSPTDIASIFRPKLVVIILLIVTVVSFNASPGWSESSTQVECAVVPVGILSVIPCSSEVGVVMATAVCLERWLVHIVWVVVHRIVSV
jgi:hypothetical protein